MLEELSNLTNNSFLYEIFKSYNNNNYNNSSVSCNMHCIYLLYSKMVVKGIYVYTVYIIQWY